MNQARFRTLYTISMIVIDGVMTTIAFALAYLLRIRIPFPDPSTNIATIWAYLPMLAVQVFSIIFAFYTNKLYHVVRATSRVDEVYSIFGAVSVGTMLTVSISALTFKDSVFELDFPRAMILYAWLISIALITLGREVHRRLWHYLRMRGLGRDRVMVVGGGEPAQAIIQKIQWSPYLGYDLVGVVSDDEDRHEFAGVSVLGYISELTTIIESNEVDEVIIALPEGSHRQDIIRIVNMCHRGTIALKIFPDVFEFITAGVSIDDLGGIPLLNVRDIQLSGWKRSLKRVLDIFGASVGMVMISPLMMIFALLIRLESPGPIFYCQERMGLDGRPFQMVKFRSMRQDAEKDGPGWTVKDDPRRTKLGTWLRSHDVDEIPQLINVFLGDMSLVGPRPERPVYVEKFRRSIPRYMDRHREKAGMTGWAQVNGLRGNTSIAERTKYDLWYIENWSIWLDIKIIVRTLVGVVLGSSDRRNAY